MTSDQRRPGFRLPWSSGEEMSSDEGRGATTAPAEEEARAADGPAHAEESELEAPAAASAAPTDLTAEPPGQAPAQAPAPGSAPSPVQAATQSPAAPARATAARPIAAEGSAVPAEPAAGFMRDLVAAMRRVAEETRQASLADLRATSEQQVRNLEADSARHREELKTRAEADIAGVGEWARAEEERIKKEAEQRVVGRRAQLDQQLAAETSRAQAEAQALRERLAAYEAELDAYHAQLSDIADPAAFAAAAKRMPPPPLLVRDRAPASVTPEPAAAPEASSTSEPIHPDEEEARPAPDPRQEADAATPAPDAPGGETAATEATDVLVKGLGSFGAITGFRQALASVDGVEGVSLSLGPTGEFVFRAIHTAGFDVGAAIVELEGEAATIEERSEGRLRVTLQRPR